MLHEMVRPVTVVGFHEFDPRGSSLHLTARRSRGRVRSAASPRAEGPVGLLLLLPGGAATSPDGATIEAEPASSLAVCIWDPDLLSLGASRARLQATVIGGAPHQVGSAVHALIENGVEVVRQQAEASAGRAIFNCWTGIVQLERAGTP
jgi:hypothetical protein